MSSLVKAMARPAPSRTSADIPRTFLGFLDRINVKPTPAQAEFVRVAYDGAQPVDGSLAASLFGTTDLPVGIRRIVAAVCGARGGKTYLLVALRLVWGMLVRDLPKMAAGEEAGSLILAPRDQMRQEAYRYAVGAVLEHAWLRAMLYGEPKADQFTLRRPDGKRVTMVCGVASAGGTAGRGKWWTDVGFDECAFFRDDAFKVNDKELFRAAYARLLPGGQAILASTPWAQSGLLYEMWSKRPDDAIVAHAPTLLLKDDELNRAAVAAARHQDPDNAKREFDAEFMTTGTTVFFEGASIDAAVTDDAFVLLPGDQVAAGGDFGFRSDSSALLLVALRGKELHVFDGREERPEDGAPLKPSVTVASFAACIAGRCGYLMADQHYREAIAEHLDTHGLVFAPAPLTPADSYVRARMLLRETGRVVIHPLPFRDRLVQQMREVQGRPTSGGGMSIVHPRWSKGGHGDLCSALVLALWQLSGDAVAAPKPSEGTKEHEAMLVDRRHRRWQEDQERPQWARKSNDRGASAWWRKGA